MNNREYLIPRDSVKINDTEFPTIWNGFRFGRPTDFFTYFNDFQDFTPAEWTVTVVGTGTQIIVALRNGILRLLNSAADNDNINIQLSKASGASLSASALQALSGKNLFFETTLSINDATQSDLVLGLIVSGSNDVVGTPPTDGIYFRKDDGDAQLDFVCVSGSNFSTAINIGTIQTNTSIRLGFKLTGTDLVEYYVDDVKKGEFKSNITTALLTPTFNIQNGEAVAKQVLIDTLFVAQER